MKYGLLSEDKTSGITNLRIIYFIKNFNNLPGSTGAAMEIFCTSWESINQN